MHAHVLVFNAGSSSLKFALFRLGPELERVAAGSIESIGQPGTALKMKPPHAGAGPRAITAANHASCLEFVLEAIRNVPGGEAVTVAAHRIVHGGPHYVTPQPITPRLLAELRRLSPYDPEHLPSEIALIEATVSALQELPQVACFDTAFHHNLPPVARMLPLPRRYEAAGVRRYGFHGLSYAFLLEELVRLGDPAATQGRVILAHLGNGASLAAVHDGQCSDTTMAFTPAAGLVMGTRSGDLDPGLVSYLAIAEKMSVSQFQQLVNHESGLLGISETSSDMRTLLEHEARDSRAADAVNVFCYQARKWIGAYAAALGGLDTIVFSGGIGENCPAIRSRICEQLGFLGVTLDAAANTSNAALISVAGSRVAVRVIHTDEERMIARSAALIIQRNSTSEEKR